MSRTLEPQSKFSLDQIEDDVDFKGEFKLSKEAKKKMQASADFVSKIASSDRPIYGINTGFGRLATVKIAEAELKDLQVNLLRSHASGIGDPVSPRVVRRLLLLRTLSLGKGFSGLRPPLLERHLDYLNLNLTPYIPEQGSVGASGDLAPLSHLGLTLMGEGSFLVDQTKEISALKVLKSYQLKAFQIQAKEGLALTNGTQFSLALAMEARREIKQLLPWMEWATCMSIEAHQATASSFRADLHALKAHRDQREVAKRIFSRLRGSAHMRGHKNCDRVQDSYSFRCVPQVVGPAYAILHQAERLLEDEANSVSDNPIVFVEKKELVSGGHFHAHSVSLAADTMAMAVTTLCNLIERRLDQLINPLTTRLTPFLAQKAGVESGLMIVQTAAAALASENKALCLPASCDTIPTNGNQEDHVSMAPWASRKLLQIVINFRRLIAAEILCGARACELEKNQSQLDFSKSLEGLLSQLKKDLPQIFQPGDRIFSKDWREIERYLQTVRAPN